MFLDPLLRGGGVPLVVAGREYGCGSSRDWAAKATALLGVRAVLAESFERIHRANLTCVGVLPLQFPPGVTATTLGLTGDEIIELTGVDAALAAVERGEPATVQVTVRAPDRSGPGGPPRGPGPVPSPGNDVFQAVLRMDTKAEAGYVRHGGLLAFLARTTAVVQDVAGNYG